VTRKAEEIIAETKSVSYRATTVEQVLADFNSRWERLCTLLEERKTRLSQVSQDQKVSYIIEIITTLEIIIIEAEKELDRMGEIPDDETRIQEQKKIIQVGRDYNFIVVLHGCRYMCFVLSGAKKAKNWRMHSLQQP
jgi:hypothetical protein